jgi:hypothetical protein
MIEIKHSIIPNKESDENYLKYHGLAFGTSILSDERLKSYKDAIDAEGVTAKVTTKEIKAIEFTVTINASATLEKAIRQALGISE